MKQSWMKRLVFLTALMGLVISGMAFADNTADIRPQHDRYKPPPHEERKTMTDEQIAKVASILSAYDAENLTGADAKAINNAFREAGIRRGPGQKEAIEAAGFNPETIRSLDPPPEPKENREERGMFPRHPVNSDQ